MRWRPVTMFLILAAAPQLGGCAIHTTSRIRPEQLRPEERGASALELRGVTVRNGSSLRFDSAPAPRLEGDTVYASREGVAYRIPRSDVAALSVAEGNGPVRSVQASSMDEATESLFGRRITALEMRSGVVLEPDADRALSIRRDTSSCAVRGVRLRIALADVDRVRVVRTNVLATVLANGAILAGATGVVWAIVDAVSSWKMCIVFCGGFASKT